MAAIFRVGSAVACALVLAACQSVTSPAVRTSPASATPPAGVASPAGLTPSAGATGVNMAARPSLVRAEAGAGYALGNHTWNHRDLDDLTAAQCS
jgi:Polysaccharide deacetylase